LTITSLAILASWYLVYIIAKINAKKQYIGQASYIRDLRNGHYKIIKCIGNKHLEIQYECGNALFGYFLLLDFNDDFILCRIDTCDLAGMGQIRIETIAPFDDIYVANGKIAYVSIKALKNE
jgi:hypothetical protein